MRSDLPKILHQLAGKPMILHVISSISALSPEKNVVVVALGMDSVKEAVSAADAKSVFAVQEKQLGTGNAVLSAAAALKSYKGTVLVLCGDTPLITSETLEKLLSEKEEHQATIAVLGMHVADATGYGRLVMDNAPWVDLIVECKDCTTDEKKIPWASSGVFAFDAEFLFKALNKLEPSPVTGEYYLPALVEMASEQHLRTLMVPMNEEEAMGINDRVQLAKAEEIIQNRLRHKAMQQGATLVDPQSVFFSHDTRLGYDVVVQPNVIFGAGVVVENAVQIRAFSHIEGAHIQSGAVIGPFARIRPGSIIGENAHVGNFVEIKKSVLGEGAKANHLSYIGDARIGAHANIGAGTITCNYDGKHKHQTVIGEGAFIGSNTALVAPVTVGAGAIVGAGSVVTENVPDQALAIARGKQVNKTKK